MKLTVVLSLWMASQISCQPQKPPMKPPIRLTAENRIYKYWILERETGFEPATLALARRCSTTELFPPTSKECELY